LKLLLAPTFRLSLPGYLSDHIGDRFGSSIWRSIRRAPFGGWDELSCLTYCFFLL
jgi:hypothetical protein